VAVLIVLLWRFRARIGRGPLAATLLFLAMLAPALGFVDFYPMRYSFVADHFQYLASLPALALAAAAGARFVLRPPDRLRPGGVAATSAVLLALAVLTWRQCGIYADEETLWRDTVAKTPTAAIAHNNLGGIFLERGETDAARRHFEAALAADARFPESHVNLGVVLDRAGRRDEAIEHYRRALALDPAFADAHNNLGIALGGAGDLEGAIASFRRALAHRREFPNALYNLGVALVRAGRPREALDALERAARLAPDDADVRRALVAARAASGA
jgi:tetratricopeptide (TPR) repeat protein